MTSFFGNLLSDLLPEAPDFVYCHLSLQQLGLSLAHAKSAADELLYYLGATCTLVVPSFPFGPNVEYESYVNQERIAYDRTLTPCKVNIFSEVFRRRPGVQRSLHPIFPFACHGPGSGEIFVEDHLDDMPFGTKTSFIKLAQRETVVLGLGLNLNTNSFFHLLDEPFISQFPYSHYSEKAKDCDILDGGRFLMSRKYHYLLPSLRKRIRPKHLHDVIKEQLYYRFVGDSGLDGPLGYSLKLKPFIDHGRALAREFFAHHELPVWHQRTSNF